MATRQRFPSLPPTWQHGFHDTLAFLHQVQHGLTVRARVKEDGDRRFLEIAVTRRDPEARGVITRDKRLAHFEVDL